MRTTVTIDKDMVDELMKNTKARSKASAVREAIQEYLRQDKVAKIKALKGKLKFDEDAADKMDEILSEATVCVPRIVMAELIQSAKTPKEISVILDFIDAFNVIDQKENTWINAGKLSYELKKKGRSIHLVDCYIAVIAKENGCCIFTLNRHFETLKQEIGIDLLEL